ncbi:MAG: hypothetical protein FJW23_08620 [Acidimicrobiia bacterium]|nr:hypothetical protein [Acidimicrobiia bacterium]
MLGAEAGAQSPSYRAPRTADGKPSLDGIWQAINTANWDLEPHAARPGPLVPLGAAGAVPAGQGVVKGGEIPYQPWALAKRQEHRQNWLALDPEVRCYLPGVPRATYMPFPFRIIQGADTIIVAYEYASAVRTIAMTGAGDPPADAWMGWSQGRWEGETLVVDVRGFTDRTWFDRAGNFHSEALRVVERYTRTGPDAIQYEATIEDPKVFTRPWTIVMPLYRRLEPDVQLLEFKCVEFVEELMYGHLKKGAPR